MMLNQRHTTLAEDEALNLNGVNDANIARMYGDIKLLDNDLLALSKASIFQKAEQAEAVIIQTRVLLAHMVLTMHALKNDIERLRVAKG